MTDATWPSHIPGYLPFPCTPARNIELAGLVQAELSKFRLQQREKAVQMCEGQAALQAKQMELVDLLESSELKSWVLSHVEETDFSVALSIRVQPKRWKFLIVELIRKSKDQCKLTTDCQVQIAKIIEELRPVSVIAFKEMRQESSDDVRSFQDALAIQTRILMLGNLCGNIKRLATDLKNLHCDVAELNIRQDQDIAGIIHELHEHRRTLSRYPEVQSLVQDQPFLDTRTCGLNDKCECDDLDRRTVASALKTAGVYFEAPRVNCAEQPYDDVLQYSAEQAKGVIEMINSSRKNAGSLKDTSEAHRNIPCNLEVFVKYAPDLHELYDQLISEYLCESYSPEIHNVSENLIVAAMDEISKPDGKTQFLHSERGRGWEQLSYHLIQIREYKQKALDKLSIHAGCSQRND